MSFIKCSVNGCNQRLQPLVKPDLRDRETWIYPECDICFRPACDQHVQEIEGRRICDRCRREMRLGQSELIDLGLRRDTESAPR